MEFILVIAASGSVGDESVGLVHAHLSGSHHVLSSLLTRFGLVRLIRRHEPADSNWKRELCPSCRMLVSMSDDSYISSFLNYLTMEVTRLCFSNATALILAGRLGTARPTVHVLRWHLRSNWSNR